MCCSDRVEVEWKYILKLHPDESQRPKPSASAKPLPEHLKESDASLDINNRTDGVPEMGDPFHDPNSEQKWAEWNTAPEVTQKVTKVDLSKENRLWYYIGKSSTEARPQYTEDPSKPRNNPKSNFLEAVKPPPPPVPIYHRTSYPTAYPLKPAPIAVPPRTPVQQSGNTRPYQYKPKEIYMSTWKSPVYNPSTQKNPNSPVAHQPNVSYDHRNVAPQFGTSHGQNPHSHQPPHSSQQQYQYSPYVPPQSHSTAAWKAQFPSSGSEFLNGIHQYGPKTQSGKIQPPHPYSQNIQQIPHPAFLQEKGQTPASNAGAAGVPGHVPSQGRASISASMSSPSGTPKPPMYAVTPSSSIVYAAQSPTEYLTYVTNYPFLKNAYLRRAKTYISPYSLDGGIVPEWMPKPPGSQPSGPPTVPTPKSSSAVPSQGFNYGHQTTGPSVSRPSAQFQSPDAFQREMARAPQSTEAPKWEQMLKQLATTAGPSTTTAVTGATASSGETPTAQPSQSRYPPVGPRSSLTYELPKTTTTAPQHVKDGKPPIIATGGLQRPTPSPISDDGKEGATATTEAKALLPPLEPGAPAGETWRYS